MNGPLPAELKFKENTVLSLGVLGKEGDESRLCSQDVDHLFGNLGSEKIDHYFGKKSGKSLEFWIRIQKICMIPGDGKTGVP